MFNNYSMKIYFLDSMHGLLDIESEYNRQTEIITENIDWQISK
jgi:hypothetical protein